MHLDIEQERLHLGIIESVANYDKLVMNSVETLEKNILPTAEGGMSYGVLNFNNKLIFYQQRIPNIHFRLITNSKIY